VRSLRGRTDWLCIGRANHAAAQMIASTGLVFLAAFGVSTAAAQSGPPVRLIVPFATGGPTDIGARVIAPYLTELTKRTVIVENKPGATGVIGTELVARAAPDGATILFGTSSSMGSSPALLPNLPFDVIKDFIPVGVVATTDNVLVIHPSVPVSNVREFIAYAKANPRKITYGSSGVGSTYHLGSELFAAQTGTLLTHVPYKGAGPAAQDLIAGHIQMMMDALNSAAPNVKAAKVKALGIASLKRSPELSDVPTLAEQGVIGCEFSQWIAFFLPANTPRAIVDKLNADLNKVLANPDVKDKFAKIGLQAAPGKPDELAATLRADLARWTKVARDANIKPE
jgi:tripartite-type tricarboxylate transporter receptor subunit TctC